VDQQANHVRTARPRGSSQPVIRDSTLGNKSSRFIYTLSLVNPLLLLLMMMMTMITMLPLETLFAIFPWRPGLQVGAAGTLLATNSARLSDKSLVALALHTHS